MKNYKNFREKFVLLRVDAGSTTSYMSNKEETLTHIFNYRIT